MSWRLEQRDCREGMRDLSEGSVDMVLADPPYVSTSLAWDRAVTGWLDEVARVLKPSGSLWVFGSLRSFMALSAEMKGWHLAQDVVWQKQNGTSYARDRFRRIHEQIAHFYRGAWSEVCSTVIRESAAAGLRVSGTVHKTGNAPHWGGPMETASVYEFDGERDVVSVIRERNLHRRGEHETQKPVRLLRLLIEATSLPNDLVLDPFAGVASAGMAALAAGRRYHGFEVRGDAHAIGLRNLSGGELFQDPGGAWSG